MIFPNKYLHYDQQIQPEPQDYFLHIGGLFSPTGDPRIPPWDLNGNQGVPIDTIFREGSLYYFRNALDFYHPISDS